MSRAEPRQGAAAGVAPSGSPRHFGDRLWAAAGSGRFGCIGLDPVIERLPRALAPANPADRAQCADAMERFCICALDAATGAVGIVKPQSACFERFGWQGVRALERVCAAARERGLLVILDVKRGDIGLTAEHYAHAAFGAMNADAMTASASMGADTLHPLLHWAERAGEPAGCRGVFALVRTSNPGSDETQPPAVADALAGLVAREGAAFTGSSGWSSLGAVVAATKPADAARLRALLPHAPLLVPGFGAQGGTVETVRELLLPASAPGAFRGAVITASRSALYPFDPGDADWQSKIRAACARFADELGAVR